MAVDAQKLSPVGRFEEALLASGPAPGLEADLDLFGRLIGSWDLDVAWFVDGELRRQARGEWHFSFVLDGRAVQDVWIVPSRAQRASGRQAYEYGTSVRFYDRRIGAWQSTWIGPVRGVILRFIARLVDEEIVLEGEDGEGQALRWVFSQIGSDSFFWRNEAAQPGRPFVVTQTFSATRALPSSPFVERP